MNVLYRKRNSDKNKWYNCIYRVGFFRKRKFSYQSKLMYKQN